MHSTFLYTGRLEHNFTAGVDCSCDARGKLVDEGPGKVIMLMTLTPKDQIQEINQRKAKDILTGESRQHIAREMECSHLAGWLSHHHRIHGGMPGKTTRQNHLLWC